MPKLIDLTGRVVGLLTVLSRGPDQVRAGGLVCPMWYCRCSCGNPEIRLVEGGDLRRKTTVSCGCYGRSYVGLKKKNTIHGKSKTKEYSSWCGLNRRCFSVSCKSYKDYGGRGITVCESWSIKNSGGFDNFLRDMGLMPGKGYSIERLDVNGGYCKDNCKWIKLSEQSSNTRNSIKLTYGGVTKTQSEWAIQLNVTSSIIAFHRKNGKDFEWIYEHYTGYRNPKVYLTYRGITKLQRDWANELKIPVNNIKYHLKNGRSFEWVYNHFLERGCY